MYPRNNASPERIAIGAVIDIATGAVQTSGVAITYRAQGGAEAVGANAAVFGASGIVYYTPSQAESNVTSFVLIASKASCIPVSQTIITSASDVPGYAGLDWSKLINPTTVQGLSATSIGTVATATNLVNIGGVAQTGRDIGFNVNSNYQNASVWFDTGGTAGTTNYLHGTSLNPNSSIANCRTIANSLNLKRFTMLNGSNVTLDQGYFEFSFFGAKWTLNLANRLISSSYFEGATVSGLSSGSNMRFDNCSMGDCTLGTCTITNSALTGTLTLSAAGVYVFGACINGTASNADSVVDFGAGNQYLGMRDWAGGVLLKNMAPTDVVAITGWGRVTVDATCTGGSVRIAGNFELINSGTGVTIQDTSRWNEDQDVATAVNVGAPAVSTMLATPVDGTLTWAQVQRIASAGNGGQVSGFPAGPILLKNSAGTKTRVSATVDGAGNRTGITNPDLT